MRITPLSDWKISFCQYVFINFRRLSYVFVDLLDQSERQKYLMRNMVKQPTKKQT